MALLLSDILTDARDAHPSFSRERVPNGVLARAVSTKQRELASKALLRDRAYLAQQASIIFAAGSANAPGTAGAGTTGGLPGDVDSDGNLSAVQAPTGAGVELGTDTAQVLVSPSVVTSATSTTLVDSTQSWTVNAYTGDVVVIIGGTGLNQRRTILSNTATALTVDAWTTTPDTTSIYQVVTVQASVSNEVGVVASWPTTNTRAGYLVRTTSAGVAYLDLTSPLTATFDEGIPLPVMKHVIGGTVRFTSDATRTYPLTLTTYDQRFNPPGTYPVYVVGSEIFLCGQESDWNDVASIELRYVPEPPALTALTDTLLLPDTARGALAAHAAFVAGARVQGLPDAPGVDVTLLAGNAAEQERVWLQTISAQGRARTRIIRDEGW